jgi:Domain of unknown function (DUF4340)
MNTRGTWFLVGLAAALFAVIFFFVHPPRPAAAPGSGLLLPDLKPAAVTAVQAQAAGQPEIVIDRLSDAWHIARPTPATAQAAVVDGLLQTLAQLPWKSRLTAAELAEHADADREFGFAPPQHIFDLQQGGQHLKVLLGARTPLGDGLYVRVDDRQDIYIVDAGLLAYVPPTPYDWRDPGLINLKNLAFNRLVVTNGNKFLELQHDITNKLWHLARPVDARADSAKIDSLLLRLQDLRVTRFVTDDPKADLDAYGLQPPALTLTLAQDTNELLALQFGKNPTNSTSQVFVRRSDLNSIALIDAAALAPWRGTYDDFRDRHLLDLAALAPSQVELHGASSFTVQQQSNGVWRVAPPDDFPVDAAYLREFLGGLASLQATQFVKAVVTEPDLPNYSLAPPATRLVLRPADTNLAPVQLDFSAAQDGKVFARREDETSVYALPAADLSRLPAGGWVLRERRLWDFNETNVTRMVLRQNGRTRELLHGGTNEWAFAPGSQGIINNFAVEETAHRLGELAAAAWLARGETNLAQYGLTPDALQVTLDVKRADKTETYSLQLGNLSPDRLYSAATTLDGDTWVFDLAPQVGELIHNYLALPASP